MDNEQKYRSDQSHRLPPVPVNMRVKAADRQQIVEDELCRFKTQAVVTLVGAVLLVMPSPTHRTVKSCSYDNVATRKRGVKRD